jgi:hypothetical protein
MHCLGSSRLYLTQHDTHALWFVKWYTVNNLVKKKKIKFVNEIQTQDVFSKLLLERKKKKEKRT